MKQGVFIILALVFFSIIACNTKAKNAVTNTELHENCSLRPDPGNCRMAIKRYHYDKKEKKCKEFTYGGCNGIVPFETLEDCKKKCGCE